MATVYPRNQYVLVKRDKMGEKTAGGILLTESEQEKQNVKNPRGTVLAVGPGTPCPEAWSDDDGPRPPYARIVSRFEINSLGVLGEDLMLKPGDRIILRAYSLQAYTLVDEKEDIVLVADQDILAIVEDE